MQRILSVKNIFKKNPKGFTKHDAIFFRLKTSKNEESMTGKSH